MFCDDTWQTKRSIIFFLYLCHPVNSTRFTGALTCTVAYPVGPRRLTHQRRLSICITAPTIIEQANMHKTKITVNIPTIWSGTPETHSSPEDDEEEEVAVVFSTKDIPEEKEF